jgi:hypothetical protein
MDKIAKIIGVGVLGIIVIALIAILSGTVLWLIWDDCIPYVFPALVEKGALTADLHWWQAVTLTWVFAILLKPAYSSKNE